MLIDNWKESLKMLSVQVQAVWAGVLAVWITLDAGKQAELLQGIGFKSGSETLAVMDFIAQVSIAVAGVTVAARLKKQSNVA